MINICLQEEDVRHFRVCNGHQFCYPFRRPSVFELLCVHQGKYAPLLNPSQTRLYHHIFHSWWFFSSLRLRSCCNNSLKCCGIIRTFLFLFFNNYQFFAQLFIVQFATETKFLKVVRYLELCAFYEIDLSNEL